MTIEEKNCVDYHCPMDINRICWGSQCMAWKWADEYYSVPSPGHPGCSNTAKRASKTKGYCGMVRS